MNEAWYTDHARLLEVCDFLRARGDILTADELFAYFERPWAYTAEHDEMVMLAFDQRVRHLSVVSA